MSALVVNQLKKSFVSGFWMQRRQILSDISFEVLDGACTGFVGVNGSGKTTSLKCILGLLHPDHGNVHFFGEPLSGTIKSRIGYLPERPYFYEFLTGREFLSFQLRLHSAQFGVSVQTIDETLKRVGLWEARHRRLRSYSKGMLQRAGIGQAVVHKPRFLILDEPMSGLDPDGRRDVKSVIRELSDEGVTLFFSSHLLQDIQELCSHLVIVDEGRILFCGPKEDLLKQGEKLFELSFRMGASAPQTENVAAEGLQNRIDSLRRSGHLIERVQEHEVTLEEAFQLLRRRSAKEVKGS